MVSSQRKNWDLQRFWQTLTYFEVIPWLNCLQRLVSGKSQVPAVSMIIPSSSTILVISPLESVGQTIVKDLLAQGCSVRVLVEPNQLELAYSCLGNSLEIFTTEANATHLFQSVSSVINCRDISEALVNLAAQFLPSPELTLFDFCQPTSNLKELWGAVDDVVMGGVSSSQIQLSQGKAIFSGQVSTANNGGFASVRSRNFAAPLNLSDYDGFELRVKGDGKRYKLISRCEGKWDGLSYCYSFDTFNNYAQTIRVPFDKLIPVFRAKTVTDMGKFDPSSVFSLQLMHSKFEYDGALNPTFSPGLFYLEIESIKAYSQIPRPQWLQLQTAGAEALSSLLRQSGLVYQMIPVEGIPEAIARDCLQALKVTTTASR